MRIPASARFVLHVVLSAAASAGLVTAQALPWYLTDQFPQRSATGVPTNTEIVLAINRDLLYQAQFTLTDPSGAKINLDPRYYTSQTIAVGPPKLLDANTRYTFTFKPGDGRNDPYSFDFTTGSGPDTSPLQLIGFDPPPGTAGVGLNGPVTLQFNKPLSVMTSDAISVTSGSSALTPIATLATGLDRVVVRFSPAVIGLTKLYQILVDPSRFTDAFGNPGQKPAVSASYTTFAAAGRQPVAVLGVFPNATDRNIPLNAAVRVLFSGSLGYTIPPDAVRLLDANGKALSVQLSIFAGGYGIQLKPADLLAASQTYTIQVSNALRDVDGFPVPEGSFAFTTGTAFDLTPAAAMGTSPPYQAAPQPANVLVVLRANKPIMPLAAIEYSSTGSPTSNGGVRVAGPARISDDGLTFYMNPPAGRHSSISMEDVVDYAGNPFFGSTIDVTPGSADDNQPPVLLGMIPGDGSVIGNSYSTIAALFDKPLSAALSAGTVRLLRNGQPVVGAVPSFDGNRVTFSLNGPLAQGTYVFDINGARDLAGNAVTPASSTFTIGQVSGSMKFVSSTPANDEQNVDVNTSILLTFDTPLVPSILATSAALSDSAIGFYPADVRVDGNSLVLRPLHALLHDSTIRVTYTVSDLAGHNVSGVIAFRTGASTDAAPFTVTGAVLSQSRIIPGGSAAIKLTFSKPANLSQGGVSAVSKGQSVLSSVVQTVDHLGAIVTANSVSGDLTLVVDQRVTDLSGGAVQPFRATFPLGSGDGSGVSQLKAMRPPANTTDVPANTAISWFLSQPVDLDALQSALVIVADGQPVSGAYEVTQDRSTVTFRPDAPFASGSVVAVLMRTTVFSAPTDLHFTIAAPSTSAVPIASRFTGGGAPNAVIEVEFTAEVSTGQNLAALYLNGLTVAVQTRESHPRPRVLRFTPVTPLAPGHYNLLISPKAGGAYYGFDVRGAANTAPSTTYFAPGNGSTGIHTNAFIHIVSANVINQLSINPANFTVQAAGRNIPLVAAQTPSIFQYNNGLVITPTEALPPNTAITLTASGLEDIYGTPIPAKTWQFFTGSGASFSGPVLVETNAPVSVPNGTQFGSSLEEIPSNLSLMYRFDRPLDPAMLFPSDPRPPAGTQLKFSFSDDLMTFTVTPVPGWPKGQELQYPFVYWSRFIDLAGIETPSSINSHFLVAFDPRTSRPQLTRLFPSDGMSGLPMNPRIMATFDQPVLGASAGRVRLYDGLTPIPLNITQDNLTTLSFVPAVPLRPDYHYNLTVEGVTDASGNAMDGSVTRTFSTGALLDFNTFTASIYAPTVRSSSQVPIRVTFNKPVNPASVGPNSIPLNKASAIASSYYWISLSATYTISDDGMSVLITPSEPWIPGWPYQVLIGTVRDYAGNQAMSTYSLGYPALNFTGPVSTSSNAPVAIPTPSDTSTKVPLNTRLGVTFDRPFLPQALDSVFRLSRDGKVLSGTLTQKDSAVTFVPDGPLANSTTYRIDVGSVIDAAGNSSAPASATFTTADISTPPYQQLTLLSSTPANGDVGVALDTPLILRFSAAIDPVTVNRITVQSGSVAVKATAAGNVVTVTPVGGWPPAQAVQVAFTGYYFGSITDLSGTAYNYPFPLVFRTVPAAPDSIPPQFLSISPESGTQLTQPSQLFLLSFSKPVSFNNGGLLIYSGSQPATNITSSYPSDDPNTTAFTLTPPSNSQVTVSGTSAITDRAGNALVNPFTAQYPTATIETGNRPGVDSVTPTTYSNPTPTTPIVIHFTKTMDTSTLAQAIRITQDGDNITGVLDFLDANHTARFSPAKPYKAGSRIDVFVLETAADVMGLTFYQRYNASFIMPVTPPATVSVVQTSFSGWVASSAASVAVRFDQDLDPETIHGDSVWLRVGHRLVDGAVSLRDARTIRFSPAQPFSDGESYALTISTKLRSTFGRPAEAVEIPFEVRDAAAAAELDVVEWSTYAGQPAVHVRFTAPVDPLSLDDVHLNLPAATYVAHNHYELWLVPRGNLPADEKLTIEFPSMADRAGRPLMVRPMRKEIRR